jgi:hypothetical protein
MTTATEHTFDPPEDATGVDGRPGQLVALPADAARATIDTLLRFEEFFRRRASDAVHAELRAFCAELGWHPVCGADALLDLLGLHTLPLRWALDAADRAETVTAAADSTTTNHKETA